jgi:N-acetyl-anhydromuramyl-L-alanine amidase AmpD
MIDEWHRARGWAGIGYHYVICNGKRHGNYLAGRDGEVQEGRPIERQGAHARGANADSIGICLIGCLDKHRPTARQVRSLMELCLHLCERYDIPHTEVYGHRDVNATDCPGERLYKVLPFIRNWLRWRVR